MSNLPAIFSYAMLCSNFIITRTDTQEYSIVAMMTYSSNYMYAKDLSHTRLSELHCRAPYNEYYVFKGSNWLFVTKCS